MPLNNQKFINFIKNYSKNKRFYDSVTEISRTKTFPYNPLIINDFPMYSLDDICKESPSFEEFNTPMTTDALCYKEEDGNLTLYIIEFKFFNIETSIDKSRIKKLYEKVENVNDKLISDSNLSYKDRLTEGFMKDFKKLKSHFGDTAEFALKMKPVETLDYVLPELYKEYCNFDDEEDADDFREFLKGITKKYIVFLLKESVYDMKEHEDFINARNQGKPTHRYNRSKMRLYAKSSSLHKQLIRKKKKKIIDDYEIKSRDDFNTFLKEEGLKISN